jgi:crotonobetainyl-CoA:carnitine CoA-transferase CaiB-like acyl-CoA transferase
MCGMMNLCGETDRPPVRISFPQTYLHAGTHAATGTMIALYWREISGEGQYVDVSIREAATIALMNSFSFWDLNRINMRRAGVFRIGLSSNAQQRVSWPCRDGYVAFALFGSNLGAATNKALVDWMDSEGMAPDYLKRDWATFDLASITTAELEQIMEPIGKFFLHHTKSELWEGARKRQMQLYPVADIKDIVEDPQLHSRAFWTSVEHPELGVAITYPGPFLKLFETPCHIWRRAPLIGEHNAEIYEKELGLSRNDLLALKQARII